MIGLVADDLTGACDSASPFLRAGPVQVGVWPHLPDGGGQACLAIATDGRDQEAPEARERTRRAVEHVLAQGARPYKKVDSRLRGWVVEEMLGVLDAWPGRILLCPALPAEGRITAGGRQVCGDEVVDLATIARAGARVVLRDATDEAGLDAVAREVLATPDLLPAGTAGLAGALARALHGNRAPLPEPGWPALRRPLGLVGSKTEISALQVQMALAEGFEIERRTRDDPIDLDAHDALFLSGGGTAHGVLAALGARWLDLLGEAVPRAPVGRVGGGPHNGLVVCVKSGGFGPPDAIVTIFRRLLAGA